MTPEEIMKTRPDEDYLKWACEYAGHHSTTKASRWSHVAALLGTGSGVATALCKRFGIDPDELVGGLSEDDECCPTCGLFLDDDEV